MKIYLTIITAITAVVIFAAAPSSATDSTASFMASAVKTEDNNGGAPLLDNFNDNGTKNMWGGDTGSWMAAGGVCNAASSVQAPYEGPMCLKIDYNVSAPGSYCGYFSKLQSKNVGGYGYITFWVKGAQGGEFFKVELSNNLADGDRNKSAVYISDYMDGGVTTGWRQVWIPLDAFANISDWTSGKEFGIVFENTQSLANGPSSTQGTIYIDSIAFDPAPPDVIRINHFGTYLSRDALGGNIGDMTGTGASVNHVMTTLAGTFAPYGMDIHYGVAGSWGGIWMMFGGGASGSTSIAHTFSGMTHISFDIMAAASTKNPKVIKLELVTPSGTKSYALSGITTDLQHYQIPLTDFGIPSTSAPVLQQFNIVLEGSKIGLAGGSATGILYVDNFQLDTVPPAEPMPQ